jgi:hypothetical protein
LTEPREHVSYREIERVCRVGGDTIKAVERAEVATITERKAKMLKQVTRVAERAWQTVDDELDSANLGQATICAGVATEKLQLLAGEPTAYVEMDVRIGSNDIYTSLAQLRDEIDDALRTPPERSTLPALNAQIGDRVMEAARQNSGL